MNHIIGYGGAMKPARVIKRRPIDALEVVGFIAGVIGLCVAVGMWAGLLG